MANLWISKCKNRPKRGRKVRSISNSGQKFFYVIKPKIDNFIPKFRAPPLKKNTPFFGGATLKCQSSRGLFNMFRDFNLILGRTDKMLFINTNNREKKIDYQIIIIIIRTIKIFHKKSIKIRIEL